MTHRGKSAPKITPPAREMHANQHCEIESTGKDYTNMNQRTDVPTKTAFPQQKLRKCFIALLLPWGY
jgi:hypothetical protein